MQASKICFRAMLWSLGLAAALGFLTVLTSNTAVVGRLAGTAILTTVASGILWPISLLIDREKTRLIGTVGMGVIVVEYLGGLILIWFEPAWPWNSKIAETMFNLALHAVPAGIIAPGLGRSWAALATRTALGALGISLLLRLAAAWLLDFDDRLSDTAWVLVGCGFLASLTLLGVGTGDRRWWRWFGIAAMPSLFVLPLLGIWEIIDRIEDIPGLPEVFIASLTTASITAFANAMVMFPLEERARWVRTTTILAGIATAVSIAYLALLEVHGLPTPDDAFVLRIPIACGILTGCGSLAVIILARMHRRVDLAMDEGAVPHEITLNCPRCDKKQCLPIGDARCARCDLRITTHIEEPRCPTCGYLLFKLSSSLCPECGATVREIPGESPA